MLKPEETIPLDFCDRIVLGLCRRKRDKEMVENLSVYIHDNLKVLLQVMEGLRMWSRGDVESDYSGEAMVLSLMNLMNALRRNVVEHDGIVGSFLQQYQAPNFLGNEEVRPWNHQDQSQHYQQISGIYQGLRNMGLPGEFIDRYYLDGSLLELYDDCVNLVQPYLGLCQLESPNPRDVQEGLYLLEEKTRRIVEKFFMEEYSGARGLHGCLQEVLVYLHEKEGKKNEPGKKTE